MKFKDILSIFLFICFISVFIFAINDSKAPIKTIKSNVDLSLINVNSIYTGSKLVFPRGGVYIVVVFSSWCKSCKFENTELIEFSKIFPNIPIYGLLWMDSIMDGKRFLEKFDNPYKDVAGISDRDAVELGVAGIPELFIVGSDNKSLMHIRGEISAKRLTYAIQEIKEDDKVF